MQGNFLYLGDDTERLMLSGTSGFGDRVWLDDGDGADSSEPAFEGLAISIFPAGLTTPVAQQLSDASGAYRSVPLPSGTYTIQATPPKPYYSFSSGADSVVDAGGAHTFSLAQDEINDTTDIGVVAQSYFSGDFIAGMVYDDLNQDGAHQPFAAAIGNLNKDEGGVAGVTVTAYDSSGTAVGSDVTDASGLYTLDLSATAETDLRLEFTTLPAGYEPSVLGADNATSVVFASQGDYVDFGIFDPTAFYGDPQLAMTRFRGQDYRNGEFEPFPPDEDPETVITAAYRAEQPSGNYPGDAPSDYYTNTGWADYTDTGAVNGLAYQPTSNTLFTSAFFKANALYGPQGAGGIYSIDLDTGVVSNFLDIDAYFGADYTGPDIACDGAGDSFDPFCFHEVGQQSLGDLDISSDFQTLYSVGIRTDELFEIPIGNPPTAPGTINKYAIPQPGGLHGQRHRRLRAAGSGRKGRYRLCGHGLHGSE